MRMTVESQTASDVVSPTGTVVGAPRIWLLLEGLTLFVGSLVAFSTTTNRGVSPVGVTGARCLRRGLRVWHTNWGSPIQPGARYAVARARSRHWLVAGPFDRACPSIIWLAHIGMDRMLTFGLKYPDNSITPTSAVRHNANTKRRRTKAACCGDPLNFSRSIRYLYDAPR